MGIAEAFIAIIAGVGLVVKFIKSFLVKYVGFAVILTFQFTVTASMIAFILLFYAFALTALISIYNQAYAIPEYLNSAGGLDCFFGLLNIIGFSSAFQNGFNAFFISLSSILLFHLFKFTLSSMRLIGNELFKLGVLLGQALT